MNRFAAMTRTEAPIYNIWDEESEQSDEWTYNLPAALRFARFAARKHGTPYHVASYVEYVDEAGYLHTDFHSNARVATYTPEGEEMRA